MADGQLFKPDKDFTKEADRIIPEAQELAKVARYTTFAKASNSHFYQDNVQSALEKLAGLEKNARQVQKFFEPEALPTIR